MLQLAVNRAGFEMGLDGVEQLPVQDGLMIAGMDQALVGDFSDIASVPQEIAQ